MYNYYVYACAIPRFYHLKIKSHIHRMACNLWPAGPRVDLETPWVDVVYVSNPGGEHHWEGRSPGSFTPPPHRRRLLCPTAQDSTRCYGSHSLKCYTGSKGFPPRLIPPRGLQCKPKGVGWVLMPVWSGWRNR